MTQKIGYQYHNTLTYQRGYSAAEEEHLFTHFTAIRPGASLFLDNEGRALRAKQLVPECAVVVRSYRGEGDEGRLFETLSPEDCFELYKNTPKGLIRNLLNEPNGYGDLKKLAHWCSRVMDLFGAAGIPIVVPNFGEGHPSLDRLAELEELWAALDRWHDLHYYGCHEYGSHLGMLYNVSGPNDMFPWRVGRFEAFIAPYLRENRHQVPNVILTEFGCDSAHDNTEYRGWRTHWSEQQYFDEIQAAITKVYNQPHYVGLCIFSYGNTGKQFTESDWATFDVAEANNLQALLEGYAAATKLPPPPVEKPGLPVFPADFMSRAQWAKLIPLAQQLRIREMPTTNSSILAAIPPTGWDGHYIPKSELTPAEVVNGPVGGMPGVWLPVQVHLPAQGVLIQGWVFGGSLKVGEAGPLKETMDSQRVLNMLASITRLMDDLRAYVEKTEVK